MLGW